ncbi:uncharacterized protein DUF2628 [Hoeflea marina]|uniref:Uncharacterized protein DUF2628 n=1 Tax=Hoeflea marina TaxID=274592 RepID=A0A317PJ79_9HYPH|nr:DUF2628 domain-containing protein [Hoeflea marina]PWW00532.1 uncharacterized protein DUF2628 [Hoeflea marina]
MATQLILARPEAPLPDDGSVVIRDSFSWPAFWFSALWLLTSRLWLQAALVIFGLVIAVLAMATPHWTLAGCVLAFCIVLCVGLEGANWRVRTLVRRGWRLVDVIEAPDAETAFDMHVAGWPDAARVLRPAAAAPARARSAAGDERASIGLVPWQKG